MALSKFRLWIVLSVTFIPLNVIANPVHQLEGHRCYWCGPLAEQVHRSQRAAKCNGDKSKVTVCDEDLPYCAIVASSPPYVESRYCVKFYQDECYPLYCNSTRIWKVICPCRGELCNGPNTKRENEVFEGLYKLTQTKRLKRSLISNGAFIGLTTRRTKIDNVTVDENQDIKNQNNDNAPNTITENFNLKSSMDKTSENEVTVVRSDELKSELTVDLSLESSQPEMTTNNATETIKAEVNAENTEKSEVKATSKKNSSIDKDSVENSLVESSAAETTFTETDAVETTSANSHTTINEETTPNNINLANHNFSGNKVGSFKNESYLKIDIPSEIIDSDDLKTDIIIMSSDNPNSDIDTVTEMPKTTTMTETNLVKGTSKSGENLPAAEALQHTDSPGSRSTVPVHATSTIATTFNTNIDQSTQTTMIRNNTAVRMDAHILTIAMGIILQY